ncbi:MAG: hypothetical protein M1837_006346 [Sclerophora amabilis]|nr:MAG: hypothetical protein M1837_006346 [Sclerophora amabilis]
MFVHLLYRRSSLSHTVKVEHHGAHALFQAVITTSRSPLLECDYNGHKSNSSYFSDLDLSRTELLLTLFKTVLSPSKKSGDAVGKEKTRKVNVALGGVTCTFRRQIKPYESFEIWSRVLCWDEKWIFIVSHFVQKGAVKPSRYTLKGPRGMTKSPSNSSAKPEGKELGCDRERSTRPDVHPAIFASSIAKYVFKSGRKTIAPETVLSETGLLPPEPTAAPEFHDGGDVEWTWERVQEENRHGLEIASLFTGLDAVHGTFRGNSEPVLARSEGFFAF